MYTVDYTYDEEQRHLTDDDALEVYKKARQQHPGAIIVLDDLKCGHWDVDIYETPEEKEAFYRKSLIKRFESWRNMLSFK